MIKNSSPPLLTPSGVADGMSLLELRDAIFFLESLFELILEKLEMVKGLPKTLDETHVF